MHYFITHVGYALIVGVIIAFVALLTVNVEKKNIEERKKDGNFTGGG